MLPTTGRRILRILAVFAVFAFLAYVALGCLAFIVRADEGVAPLPDEVVVRFDSCKSAPGSSQPLFDGWSRVHVDTPGAVSVCSEVYPVYPVHLFDDPATTLPNDPSIGQQYSLPKMSVPSAWDTARGDGVVVAVLDTGADLTHPDLAAKFVGRGRDFVNGDNDASDDHGHGTHVSGIIAAATNNGAGIAGVGYNTRVLPVKVLSATGNGETATIAQAIDWASQQSGVRVINMSLGCQCPSPAYLTDAIARARSRGVVVIAAAGNDATSAPASPASAPGVIGVGSTDSADRRSPFSNFGVNAKVAAPGSYIYSTLRGGGYGNMSGTSMAAPNASGVAALVWSACPSCSVGEVEARLLNGDDIGGQQIGKRINAARAVGSAGLPTLTPAPTVSWPTATPAPDRDGQIVAAINVQRAQQGLGPLALDPALARIAREHNQYMDEHDCFAHECPGEPTVWQRLASAGYPNAAGSEVIARGYDTIESLVNGWLGSPAHRAILLGSYTHIGCAWDEFATGYLGRWMTCDVGRRSGAAPPTPWPTATTAPPTNGLPGGWRMLVYLPRATGPQVYDYDDPAVTKTLTDAVYRHVCQDLQPQGARCEWRRK